MGNRVLEAKALKSKRQRRAWNRYGNIKSGAIPSRVVIEQYRMSARGLDGSSEAIAEKIALGFKGVTPGRVEALKRQAELEARMPDGCDLFVSGPGPTNSFQSSKIYFNSKKDQFLIVHWDYRRRTVKRSIIYSSYAILECRWETDRIVWVSSSEIPPKP